MIDYRLPAEFKSVDEVRSSVRKYAKALAATLGYGFDHNKKGKRIPIRPNIPPAGGDCSFYLWLPNSKYGVFVDFSIHRNYSSQYGYHGLYLGNRLCLFGSLRNIDGTEIKPGYGDLSMMWRIADRSKSSGTGINKFEDTFISVGELAEKIKRQMSAYRRIELWEKEFAKLRQPTFAEIIGQNETKTGLQNSF